MRLERLLPVLLVACALQGLATGPAAAKPGAAADAEVADVVVVGAGPAGMAAALEAKRAGAGKVILLERRGPQRERHHVLGLLPGALDALEHLGLDTKKLEAKRVRYHLIDGENVPVKRFRPRPGRASSRIDDRVKQLTPSMLLETRDLELAMQELVKREGVEIRYHSPVTGAELAHRSGKTPRGPPGSEPVVLTTGSPGGGERRVEGRFVVVADGAHSPTRGFLGIDVAESETKTHLMVGVFEQPGDGGFEGIYGDGANGRARSVYRLGGVNTGVVVEPPPGLKFSSKKQAIDYFREEAARLGVRGDLSLEPRMTPIELRRTRVDPVALRHQVFVIGEAVRSSHAHSVSGVSWAFKDAIRFGETLRSMMRAKDPRRARRSYRRFVRETDRSTRVLHRRLEAYFGGRPRALLEERRAGGRERTRRPAGTDPAGRRGFGHRRSRRAFRPRPGRGGAGWRPRILRRASRRAGRAGRRSRAR